MTSSGIHPTAVLDHPVTLGEGVKIWHFCHVMRGATIGANAMLGQNVFVAEDVKIGNGVRIQNNVSVYRGVELQDDVFVGPSVVFTNVLRPRAFIDLEASDYARTLVKRGASIGANATIVCGVRIGEYALIGAGSVVTADVPAHALVFGNPARIQGWVCVCGEQLTVTEAALRVTCPACHKTLERISDGFSLASHGN